MMLGRMKIVGVTVHGFRGTGRGDLFDKRRKLMDAWAAYCATPKAGKIVAFRR